MLFKTEYFRTAYSNGLVRETYYMGKKRVPEISMSCSCGKNYSFVIKESGLLLIRFCKCHSLRWMSFI